MVQRSLGLRIGCVRELKELLVVGSSSKFLFVHHHQSYSFVGSKIEIFWVFSK